VRDGSQSGPEKKLAQKPSSRKTMRSYSGETSFSISWKQIRPKPEIGRNEAERRGKLGHLGTRECRNKTSPKPGKKGSLDVNLRVRGKRNEIRILITLKGRGGRR